MKVIFSTPDVTYQLVDAPSISRNGNDVTSASMTMYDASDLTVDTEITGIVKFVSDDDMDLMEFDSTGFLRHTVSTTTETIPGEVEGEETEISKSTLYFTNTPIPVEPPPPEPPTEEELLARAKSGKDVQIDSGKNTWIGKGIVVETSYGTEHFSLGTDERVMILGIYGMIQGGATTFPYHSIKSDSGSNNMCVVYSDADIINITTVAFGYITFHESYTSMLHEWLARETDIATVYGITYGADLPDDLYAYLNMVLAAVGMNAEMFPFTVPEIDESTDTGTESEAETPVDETVVDETATEVV